MGIDVQSFAQRQTAFHNANSACIQCGICIEVCPMGVLELDRGR
jgi:ferredoxin